VERYQFCQILYPINPVIPRTKAMVENKINFLVKIAV